MSNDNLKERLTNMSVLASSRTPADALQYIEELEDNLAEALEAGVGVAASLIAAISLLERGGKKAAPSDKMFNQMLVDYKASLARFRNTLAELTGGNDD